MATVELSADELDFLLARLQACLSDLRMEIADTDNSSFKAGLREEKAELLALIGKLRDAAADEA
jgi:hypothetical protein